MLAQIRWTVLILQGHMEHGWVYSQLRCRGEWLLTRLVDRDGFAQSLRLSTTVQTDARPRWALCKMTPLEQLAVSNRVAVDRDSRPFLPAIKHITIKHRGANGRDCSLLLRSPYQPLPAASCSTTPVTLTRIGVARSHCSRFP